ncbi:galactose oxidase-like domain-containing protein [Kineococcus sp. DHX-1]|uniref:galactose oxidase-like domain-containing protein n=1 Tax=Kineococcus sp. DHX-1 TaxID=3349638 RepID=UPI0036D3E8CF
MTALIPASATSRRNVLRAGAAAVLVGLGTSVALRDAGSASAATAGTYAVGSTPVALNTPSDPAMGRTTPATDATTRGMFGAQVPWPVIPIHVAVGRNGHLTSWGTPVDTAAQGGTAYDDWDVAGGFSRAAHTQTASMHDYNSFCNGPAILPDGRFLMVGGNSSSMTMLYDPVTHEQTMGQNVRYQRWYATSLRLPDGRVLVLGGGNYYNTGAYRNPQDNSGVATVPEIGTGTGAWTSLTGAASTMAFGAEDNRWWYPRAFNGPRGTVVGTSGDQVWNLSVSGTGTISKIGTLPFNPRVSGSQVMYAPGKILVSGGGQPFNEDGTTATAAAAVVDVTGTTARTTSTSPMAENRNWHNLTVLPTGDVLASGGTRVGTAGGDANSVKQAEIWNPASGTWRPAATAARTRTYHSTALLMPSGAVFTGGGGVPGPEDNLNAELFYPPYLFTRAADGSTTWASRPVLTSIAGSATHGGTVTLGLADTRTVSAASLISTGCVTHSENTDQRRVPLTVRQNGATVSATLPTSVDVLPPGDYLLTVVDAAGVPSAAQVLTIRRGAPGLVTVGSATQVVGTGEPVTDPTGTVPLTVDTAVGLEAVNFAGYRVMHENFAVYLRQAGTGSADGVKTDTSWAVRPGLADAAGVSFEAVTWPGYYLAAPTGGGATGLVKNDGTKGFAARATFAPVTGATGQGTTFQVWATARCSCATRTSRCSRRRPTPPTSGGPTARSPCAGGSSRRRRCRSRRAGRWGSRR